MKGKLSHTYRKQETGNLVFVYLVIGIAAMLKEYKSAQGTNYVENDDGVPLYFTTIFNGDDITLGISSKGSVYTDTSEMDKARSIVEQNGGNLGQALAERYAQKFIGGGNSPIASPSAPEAAPAKKDISNV